MAATLAEPAVLAAAKDALYPDLGDDSTRYAVTETQFTVEEWGDWPIPDDVRERLAPFNAVRLHSGEPDLLGVGMPETDVLNASAASSPVVAVEAKGHNTDPGRANVGRAVEQAHSHLPEVNLGFVAAPARSVTDTTRSLARKLNVGVLGVHADHSVEVVEPARVTGAGEFSSGVEAIRFRASTHHLTDGTFPLNHPKNYLGYVLALAADGSTADVYAERVVREVRAGRRGAVLLGLIDDGPPGDTLTALGQEIVRAAHEWHGGVGPALEQFDDWTGMSTRFTELAPRWARLARAVTMQYAPTRLVVGSLERLHDHGVPEATLPQLVRRAYRRDPTLAVEVFFSEGSREDVLDRDGDLKDVALDDPVVYKTGAHFQFKAQLFHVGLVTSRGEDTSPDALDDEWQLEHPVGSR